MTFFPARTKKQFTGIGTLPGAASDPASSVVELRASTDGKLASGTCKQPSLMAVISTSPSDNL
jgi:hypothetical protein